MALTKAKKEAVINEVKELISQSKMTVIAKYRGINVKALQELRKEARASDTKVKVIKNRLVVKALTSETKYKDIDTKLLEGMLLYAFNNNDEVGAAQVLNKFAKLNTNLEFVGAINEEGKFVPADEVKVLANLPTKVQLIATVLNMLTSPIRSVSSNLSGGLGAIMQGLEAKANN